MENNLGRKTKLCLWYAGIFAFMFVWFTKIHPLALYDADDWTYISYVRKAVPSLQEWNPARIFPEVFMPLCGAIAAHIVMPLIGDYVWSVTLVSAAVVSIFIAIYVLCLGTFVKRLFNLNDFGCRCTEFLFLILHFMVFVHDRQNNEYLFYCYDLTCYYYYLIPALVNASLVMMMAGNSWSNEFALQGNLVKQSIFVLVIYFAVFSNLADSFILAIYSGIAVLCSVGRAVKEKKCTRTTIIRYLKSNALHLYTLILWGISAVYEFLGQRAAAIAALRGQLTFTEGVKQAIINLYDCRRNCHRVFFGIALLIVIVAGVLFIASRKKHEEDKVYLKMQMTWTLAAILACFYTILLCSKVELKYIYRSEYLFGMFFYGLLILMTAFAYVLKQKPQFITIIPLLLCIAVSYINTPDSTFKESNGRNEDTRVCLEASRDWVEQVVCADQEGKDEVVLHVLCYNESDNWPYTPYFSDRMSTTLLEHGIVGKRMQITMQPVHISSP